MIAIAALAVGLWLGFCAGITVAIYVSAREERQRDGAA